MQKNLKYFLSIWIAVSLLFATFVADAMNITGTYLCSGHDATPLHATFIQKMIIARQGDAYPIVEAHNGKITPYKQLGILTGDFLSVAYQSTDLKQFGVQVYTISDHGKKLVGPFIPWRKSHDQGLETCEKISNELSLK